MWKGWGQGVKTRCCQDHHTEKDAVELLCWCEGQVSSVGHIWGCLWVSESSQAFSECSKWQKHPEDVKLGLFV